jgi:acetyl esterase/lipase
MDKENSKNILLIKRIALLGTSAGGQIAALVG